MLSLAWVFTGSGRLHAEDILFFGNSFTSGNNIPLMVETIAISKGKTLSTMAVTKGGQGFPYHLAKPATDSALESRAWNWVVLQDYSLNATHANKGKPGDFLKIGEQFYDRVAQKSPASGIVLYETWAYDPAHPVFVSTDEEGATFANPAQMLAEIQKNYAALKAFLESKEPKKKILLAPVGTAFARCLRDHPEIHLYEADLKHQNLEGAYLSALVIYATLFKESTLGAAPGKKVNPALVKTLQEVADATVGVTPSATSVPGR